MNKEEKYIDISKIDSKFKNCIDGNTVYQIQAKNSSNKCTIMKVGEMVQKTDILINKFDLSKQIQCFVVSSLYDLNGLKETNCLNMIKLIINLDNSVSYWVYYA